MAETKPTATAVKSSTSVQPKKDVITEKAISKKGLFHIHKVEEKCFF